MILKLLYNACGFITKGGSIHNENEDLVLMFVIGILYNHAITLFNELFAAILSNRCKWFKFRGCHDLGATWTGPLL